MFVVVEGIDFVQHPHILPKQLPNDVQLVTESSSIPCLSFMVE
jgi:hypothetical protein